MNDVLIFGCLFACVVATLVAFFFYFTYRGVNDNLTSAVVGAVYNFRYFQPVTGTYERYLAKVVKVYKLTREEINRLNWSSDYRRYDKDFQRSPTLVTCQMANGEYRQFYAERSDMCRRTLTGNLLYSMGVAHLF